MSASSPVQSGLISGLSHSAAFALRDTKVPEHTLVILQPLKAIKSKPKAWAAHIIQDPNEFDTHDAASKFI